MSVGPIRGWTDVTRQLPERLADWVTFDALLAAIERDCCYSWNPHWKSMLWRRLARLEDRREISVAWFDGVAHYRVAPDHDRERVNDWEQAAALRRRAVYQRFMPR